MGDGTAIEWTDATWNPIVGCSVVSPGCTNCYAMRQAPRTDALSAGTPWAGPPGKLTQPSKAGPVWTGAVRLVERRLDQPLRWQKRRKIFVNSMGDLFHENVPDDWIDRVFRVMADAPHHTFQVLTKRATRMREYLTAPHRRFPHQLCSGGGCNYCGDYGGRVPWSGRYVFSNVWLGVSVEDQSRANERIPDLLATPAAVRFLSCEPLLGPVDLRQYLVDPATDWMISPKLAINWVIVGGESGPGARPFNITWASSLIDQCRAAGASCFVKQMGAVPYWLDAANPHWAEDPAGRLRLKDRKGGDWSEWPADLRVRQFPERG